MGKINFSLEEKKLSERLCNLLSSEFDIILEEDILKSPGKFLLDGKEHRSIPDLLIKPKDFLLADGKFIDTVIPVEIKKFVVVETSKFEDLMFQCHSYRFSTFDGIYPKLCLYFIDDYFEVNAKSDHLNYDYEASKDAKSNDYQIRNKMRDKNKIETLFGRFGIGEIITNGKDYTFRIKRQILFQKCNGELIFKPSILNFWWGSNGNPKKLEASI
jgi:hypothetical protein